KGQTIGGVDHRKTIAGDDFWIDFLIAPARDSDGEVFGICINITNITALKQAEQEIQAVNQRFKMAAESGNLGVWEWDIPNQILVWDEGMYSLYGIDPTDETDPQILWQRQIHTADKDLLIQYFTESIADPQKTELDMDYRIDLPHGDVRYLRGPGHIVRNKEGSPIKVTGISFDITDIKMAELELRRAKELAEEMSRLKSNFLANMSHEIRTPLNGILGLLPVLEIEEDPEEVNFMIDMMQKSGQRLLNTLTGILELARLEAEEAEYKMEIIYLNDLVPEIFEALQSATIGHDFEYQLFLAPSDTAVLADERLLSQILTNIIGNAIKFTQRGYVRVSVIDKFHYNDHVYTAIRVEDTGVGIADESQNRIFDPFKQESEGTTRRFEGSGLGLSIAKKYTTMMGGDILLQSEKHKGSAFTVYLPKQVG
ncbi:MAG: ATP-binding protein, partial [Bacteroidota bacterium]